MVTVRTYAAVWTWERRIYRLERVRLPMPVTFRWIGLFAGTLLLVVVPLGKVLPLPWPVIWYTVVPWLVADYLSKARLDGKTPLAWLQTLISWALMPKRYSMGQPIKPGKRRRMRLTVKAKAAGV